MQARTPNRWSMRRKERAKMQVRMGYIDTDGLDNVGVIYRAYHGLKGNGTGTNLYKRICALPIKEGDEPRPELP